MSALISSLHRFVPRSIRLHGFRCRYNWLVSPKDEPPSVDYASLLREIDDFHRKLAK